MNASQLMGLLVFGLLPAGGFLLASKNESYKSIGMICLGAFGLMLLVSMSGVGGGSTVGHESAFSPFR